VIDLDEEAYEPADDIEIYEPEPATLLDDAEEEDYSPPPADIVANEPSRGRGRNQNHNGANGYDHFFPSLFFLFFFRYSFLCTDAMRSSTFLSAVASHAHEAMAITVVDSPYLQGTHASL
jgi:hypothetical protein